MPLLSKASNVVQNIFFLYDVTGFTQIRHSIPVATSCTFPELGNGTFPPNYSRAFASVEAVVNRLSAVQQKSPNRLILLERTKLFGPNSALCTVLHRCVSEICKMRLRCSDPNFRVRVTAQRVEARDFTESLYWANLSRTEADPAKQRFGAATDRHGTSEPEHGRASQCHRAQRAHVTAHGSACAQTQMRERGDMHGSALFRWKGTGRV